MKLNQAKKTKVEKMRSYSNAQRKKRYSFTLKI